MPVDEKNRPFDECCIPAEYIDEEVYLEYGMKKRIDYGIYCILRQNMSFPFEDLELIRNNKGVYEHGNRWIEDDRYWTEFDIEKLYEKYSEPDEQHFNNSKLFGKWKRQPDVKRVSIFQMINFVVGIRNFLTDNSKATAACE